MMISLCVHHTSVKFKFAQEIKHQVISMLAMNHEKKTEAGV